MVSEKVTVRMEEGMLVLLMKKYGTDNQSEAIRLAVMESLVKEDSEKLKTIFPYVGKKPPRIGKEVVQAYIQSGCSIFVDLFCGRLQATIYFLAVQMIQVSPKGVPRNPAFRAYYERRLKEGKPTKQILICISRRLISIIYGMLKNQTEYRMPQLESYEMNLENVG